MRSLLETVGTTRRVLVLATAALPQQLSERLEATGCCELRLVPAHADGLGSAHTDGALLSAALAMTELDRIVYISSNVIRTPHARAHTRAARMHARRPSCTNDGTMARYSTHNGTHNGTHDSTRDSTHTSIHDSTHNSTCDHVRWRARPCICTRTHVRTHAHTRTCARSHAQIICMHPNVDATFDVLPPGVDVAGVNFPTSTDDGDDVRSALNALDNGVVVLRPARLVFCMSKDHRTFHRISSNTPSNAPSNAPSSIPIEHSNAHSREHYRTF